MIRNITGWLVGDGGSAGVPYSGAFFSDYEAVGYAGGDNLGQRVYFDVSRVVPTGAANKTRAWGALACAYLGQPAS